MLNPSKRRALAIQAEAIEIIEIMGESQASILQKVHPTTDTRWLLRHRQPSTAALIALRAVAKCQLPGMNHKYWIGRVSVTMVVAAEFSERARCVNLNEPVARYSRRASRKS